MSRSFDESASVGRPVAVRPAGRTDSLRWICLLLALGMPLLGLHAQAAPGPSSSSPALPHAQQPIRLPWIPAPPELADAANGGAIAGPGGSTLGLAGGAIVHLDLPATLPGEFSVVVPIEGEVHTLSLRPASIRAPGFRYVVDGPAGPAERLPPAPRTLRGTVLEQKGAVVAGALQPEGLEACWVLADGRTCWIQPFGPARDRPAGAHVVYTDGDVLPGPESCGVSDVPTGGSAQPFGSSGCGADFCLAELACVGDTTIASLLGNDPDRVLRVMESIVAIGNLQFERDVQVSHRLSHVLVHTVEPDPYWATIPDDLLLQFQAEWNQNQALVSRDVALLLTAINITTFVGLAFPDTVCVPPLAYCLVKYTFTTNLARLVGLVTHELGHCWGADHCACSSPAYTMNPTATGALRFHPTETIPELADHRNQALCLEPGARFDACGQALVICSGTIDGSTSGASQDGNATCAPGATADAWFSYTPASAGPVTIQVVGSAMDVVLSVHAGCPGTAANQLACDAGSGAGGVALVDPVLAAGQAVLIRVAGANGATGAFSLTVAGPPCPTPLYDTCEQAMDICPGRHHGNTQSTTADGQASCGGSPAAGDLWYRYTARFNGVLVLDTCGSAIDTVLSVHDGCPATPQNELACSDSDAVCASHGRLELDVTAGQTLLIRVSGSGSTVGPIELGLAGPQCAHSSCGFAQPVQLGTHLGHLLGAVATGESSCGATQYSPDVYYDFTAPYAGLLVVTTCGTHDAPGLDSGPDTVLSLHSQCPGLLTTELTCNDDDAGLVAGHSCAGTPGSTWDAVVSWPVTAGQRVFIRVATAGATRPGPFILNIELDPSSPFFVRGDVNADGSLDLIDPIYLLHALLLPGFAPPPCLLAADLDDADDLNLLDVVLLLHVLFIAQSPLPVDPHPDCGHDPSVGALDCQTFPPCP